MLVPDDGRDKDKETSTIKERGSSYGDGAGRGGAQEEKNQEFFQETVVKALCAAKKKPHIGD